jgi:hypothetical protein
MAKSYIGQNPQTVSLVSALTEHAAGQTVNGVTFGKVVSYCISDFNRDGYNDVKITYDNNVEVILVNAKNAMQGAENAARKLNEAREQNITYPGSAFIVKKYNTLDDEVEDYKAGRHDGTTLNFDSGVEANATTKSYELVVGRDAQSAVYALLQAKPAAIISEGQTYAVADGKVTGEQLIDIRNALSDKTVVDVSYTTTTAQPKAATASVEYSTPQVLNRTDASQNPQAVDNQPHYFETLQTRPGVDGARSRIGNPFGQGSSTVQQQQKQQQQESQYQNYQSPVEYQERKTTVQQVRIPAAQTQSAAIAIRPSTVHAATLQLNEPATFRAFTFGKTQTDFYGGAEFAHVTLPKGGTGTMIVMPVKDIDKRIADLQSFIASTSTMVTAADKQEARITLARLQAIKPLLSDPNNFYATLVAADTDVRNGFAAQQKTQIVSVALFQPD